MHESLAWSNINKWEDISTTQTKQRANRIESVTHGSTVSNLLPSQAAGKSDLFSADRVMLALLATLTNVDPVPPPLAHSVSRVVYGTVRTSLRSHRCSQSG